MNKAHQSLPDRQIHVGVDATTWRNDRGFGRFTRELLTTLAGRDKGFRYTLVLDRPMAKDAPEGVDILVAGTGQTLDDVAVGDKSRSLGYLLRMGEAVRKANFDIFFFPAVFSYFPLFARLPCVICYHDTTAERIPEFLFPKKVNHRLWQAKTSLAKLQTTRAMTVSKASAKDLETILKIPRAKIDIVTEAADPIFRAVNNKDKVSAIQAKYHVPPNTDYMITVGGMNAHKNILGLLKAMPGIIAKHPDVHLVIVGDTSGKGFWDNVPELKSFVADDPALSERVHFTGFVADDDLVYLLNGGAALAFPSLWEGFGLPAVEAMACGLPVLASNRGSLPEVVGEAGLFYDPENLAEIEACVSGFFEQPALREQLSVAARVRAASFTWSRGAELAEESFRKCFEARQ